MLEEVLNTMNLVKHPKCGSVKVVNCRSSLAILAKGSILIVRKPPE